MASLSWLLKVPVIVLRNTRFRDVYNCNFFKVEKLIYGNCEFHFVKTRDRN